MEQAPQETTEGPRRVNAEVAMRAAELAVEVLPKIDPEARKRAALPDFSGPISAKNAQWRLDVIARGKEIQREQMARDIEEGRLDPRDLRAR